LDLARAIVNALEEKKGEDILLLDIEKVASFASYFVICTGTSARMLDALADAVLETSRSKFKKKGRPEGTPDDGWVVVDYGSVGSTCLPPKRVPITGLKSCGTRERSFCGFNKGAAGFPSNAP